MELLKDIKIEKKSLLSFDSIRELWKFSWNHVSTYRALEIDTYWDAVYKASQQEFVSEKTFTMEYLFSVYSAGFKASIVTLKFEELAKAHGIVDSNGVFVSALLSSQSWQTGYNQALVVIGNKMKAKAIQDARAIISGIGWDQFHKDYLAGKDPEKIGKLPFMGPALRCHVARNLGNVNIAKPDIHLNRLAQHYGIESAQKLCEIISGYPVAFNDLVLWLTSADNKTR